MGETTNKGKTSDIGPQSSGQKRVHKNKKVWVGPLAGAEETSNLIFA